MSSAARLMAAEQVALLYNLYFMVCRQCYVALPLLSRRPSPGTSVAVYGTFGVDTSRSSYRLDNSDPILFSVGPRTTPLYQQLFFKSPTLTDGEHTLVITDVGIGAFWIDYILYVPSVPQPISSSTTTPPPPTPTTPTPTPPTPTPFTSTTTTTPKPVNNTPTPKPPSTTSQTDSGPDPPGQTNSNAPSGKSSIPPAAVAGGAIGALVLIIALVFAMLYYRKRARRLAGAKLLEKEGVLDGKMTAQASPRLMLKHLHVPQTPRNLAGPNPVLSSYPLQVHITPLLISIPVTGTLV